MPNYDDTLTQDLQYEIETIADSIDRIRILLGHRLSCNCDPFDDTAWAAAWGRPIRVDNPYGD